MNPADYFLDANSRPARLHFESRPEPLRVMNGIEIDFTAGFGEAGPDVPDSLRRAILVLVAHWFEFRASVGPQDQPVDRILGRGSGHGPEHGAHVWNPVVARLFSSARSGRPDVRISLPSRRPHSSR